MISLYFGLPGCGKTTLMSKFALKFTKGRKYKNVYGNVHLAVPGYTYIDNECIGKYELVDGALLIDEGVLFACNRNYKNFGMELTKFFMEHRHDCLDIYIFSQSADLLDKQIRTITDRVYYIYKPFLFGKFISKYYRIPYDIVIPKRDDNSQKLGEIIQGYCQPSKLQKIFCTQRLYRPFYYKFFDSWVRTKREQLPLRYQPYSVKKK